MLSGHLEQMGPIATAIVSKHAVHLRAAVLKSPHGPENEAGGGNCLLVRQKLTVGQAAVIINACVRVIPARTPLTPGAVTGDAMAHAVYPSQLLDVKVNHIDCVGGDDHLFQGLRVAAERSG